MAKKVLFSAKSDHDVIKGVIEQLNKVKDVEFIFHDPVRDFLDLEDISELYGNLDLMIVKYGAESSIDLLHFAKTYNIPTLHDVNIVNTVKNKVALDHNLRKIFNIHAAELGAFELPQSWTQNAQKTKEFKGWASFRLPIVIKSHYQHDKYMRFNFLVREIEEVEIFREKYSNFLYYDVYVQKFIECDGIDRKIYVIGDKVFGIRRENPIYKFIRDNPEDIDVETLDKKEFEVSNEIKALARILSKELNLKIFGFDLLKPINQEKFFLIDLNDFPGLRGIANIENILVEYLIKFIESNG